MLIAVVDDTKKEQKIIYDAVKKWAREKQQKITFEFFDCGEDFAQNLDTKHYDLVFMDIYMKEMTGIDAAIELRKYSLDTVLIFLTTSVDHMANAFPCHAFDYILKPIDTNRLYKTLDEALKTMPDNEAYIKITFEKQEIALLYSDINSVLSDSNYCLVNTKNNEFRTRSPFNTLTSQFGDDTRFCTISRGILVNLDNVSQIKGLDCIMKNNETLPVSRRKKDDVEKALLNRRFEKRRKGD